MRFDKVEYVELLFSHGWCCYGNAVLSVAFSVVALSEIYYFSATSDSNIVSLDTAACPNPDLALT